ncbi:MAG: hypothetical protein R3F34_20905, partial [Planctomycetota bacterium]
IVLVGTSALVLLAAKVAVEVASSGSALFAHGPYVVASSAHAAGALLGIAAALLGRVGSDRREITVGGAACS